MRASLCLPEERRETVHKPTIGRNSLHYSTNENGLRLIEFAAGKQLAIKSMYFMELSWNGQHFSHVNDAKARRGANIDSDHMLGFIKLRYRISKTPQQLKRLAVKRLNDGGVGG
jgi:hypothetical protein